MEVRLGALAATLAAKTEEESADFFLVSEILESQDKRLARQLDDPSARCHTTTPTSRLGVHLLQATATFG